MTQALAGLGEWVTIILMAAALGMDALSLGVGIGMKGVRRMEALRIGFLVALFHILMPLLGIFAGQYVGVLLGDLARYASGGLLLLLGVHMILSSWKGGDIQSINTGSIWGAVLFSLSVSIDSFSVGISMGIFQGNLLWTVLAFGFFGGLMSLIGLGLGGKIGQRLGDYGEAVGGAILFAFGLLFIF